MTRACLISALHPEEEDSVILRVSYSKKGWMRVGVEAIWRVTGRTGGGGGDGAAQPQGNRRTLSGWDGDMPAVRLIVLPNLRVSAHAAPFLCSPELESAF